MNILDYSKDKKIIERYLTHASTGDRDHEETVRKIIDGVRRRGDKALLEYTAKFDGAKLTANQLKLSPKVLQDAWKALTPKQRGTMQTSARRIKAFHEKQKRKSFELKDKDGVRMMHRVQPLDSVGLYVPGGAAAYPSTVLMCAIPAKVAGVKRIVMVTPPPREGVFNQASFAAAHLAGVTEVYQIGGAQAVAALAYGTATVPNVAKVVGPGNVFVALAKRMLYGQIDIDSIAGPSEIMVIADETANPDYVAADLLSQAEHDPDAIPLCVTIGKKSLAEKISVAVTEHTNRAPRKAIIRKSLKRNGAIICVRSVTQAIEIANKRAPEHLEILTKDARKIALQIDNAGSIFVGPWTPESFGDYTAGSNHVLPTAGTARFFSPLSVDDYIKHSNIIECSKKALDKLGPATIDFAEMEGLNAHAEAIRVRLR